jgi:hypothetical protein
MRVMLLAAVLAATVPAGAAIADDEAKVDKSAPDYVKCRRLDITGSLAKKVRVCKTNAEWSRLAQKGSADADEIQTRNLQGSSTNGN